MARDPKKKHIGDRRRLLTIHDGTRLTPTIIALLAVLADYAEEISADNEHGYDRRDARMLHVPVLVSRSDGLAIYVDAERERRLG